MIPFFQSMASKGELICAASEWHGTPFKAHGKVRGVGVDCVQLAAQIYQRVGFIETCAFPPYVMDGGQHNNSSLLVEWVESTNRFICVWTDRTDLAGSPVSACGDLLCFRIGRVAWHVGIAVNPVKFVHVFQGSAVAEAQINDSTWRKRLTRIYRPSLPVKL